MLIFSVNSFTKDSFKKTLMAWVTIYSQCQTQSISGVLFENRQRIRINIYRTESNYYDYKIKNHHIQIKFQP